MFAGLRDFSVFPIVIVVATCSFDRSAECSVCLIFQLLQFVCGLGKEMPRPGHRALEAALAYTERFQMEMYSTEFPVIANVAIAVSSIFFHLLVHLALFSFIFSFFCGLRLVWFVEVLWGEIFSLSLSYVSVP
jgi:hypothetical protein